MSASTVAIPVDASPAPPALNPNYVSPTNQAVANDVAQQAQNDTAQPTQAPQAKPSIWAGILQGALQGMAGSVGGKNFGGGLALGARGELASQQQQVENTQKQEQIDSNIKFQSAQAAHAVLQAKADDLALQNLPTEQQDAHAAITAATQEKLFGMGISPTLVTNNSHDAAIAGLQQLTSTHGSVPDSVIYNSGDTHSLFSVSDVAQQPAAVKLVNDYLEQTGQSTRFQSLAQLHASGMQETLVKQALSFGHEVPTPETADTLATQAENVLKTYAAQPGADKSKTTTLANNALRLRAASDHFQDAKADEAAKVATAELPSKIALQNNSAANTNARKDNDPVVAAQDDGTNIVTSRAEAEAAGQFHYKLTDPGKLSGFIASVNDVQTKFNQLASVVNDPSYKNVQAGLAAALLESQGFQFGVSGIKIPFERINAGQYKENLAEANPATRNFVVATLAAHEALTTMGRIQSFGTSNRVVESQVQAAQKMLAIPGDDQGMAIQKMDSLQQQIDPIRKLTPRMPGAALVPSYKEKQ